MSLYGPTFHDTLINLVLHSNVNYRYIIIILKNLINKLNQIKITIKSGKSILETFKTKLNTV